MSFEARPVMGLARLGASDRSRGRRPQESGIESDSLALPIRHLREKVG